MGARSSGSILRDHASGGNLLPGPVPLSVLDCLSSLFCSLLRFFFPRCILPPLFRKNVFGFLWVGERPLLCLQPVLMGDPQQKREQSSYENALFTRYSIFWIGGIFLSFSVWSTWRFFANKQTKQRARFFLALRRSRSRHGADQRTYSLLTTKGRYFVIVAR